MMLAADARFGLALDREQGALVMDALAERSFRSVYELIGRLNTWANHALVHPGVARAPFVMTQAELALVIDALGDLPHRRVHVLLGSLQQQVHQMAQRSTQQGQHASYG
jgi:hypothetical protein